MRVRARARVRVGDRVGDRVLLPIEAHLDRHVARVLTDGRVTGPDDGAFALVSSDEAIE